MKELVGCDYVESSRDPSAWFSNDFGCCASRCGMSLRKEDADDSTGERSEEQMTRDERWLSVASPNSGLVNSGDEYDEKLTKKRGKIDNNDGAAVWSVL
ncbi:uncharacterized protein CCOS01_15204 [Colletotrichum costaricense]|uniref:Uncharacterized protein n=1 Tax=Colletotrichum costaricense TaxID=1209916 RepID=A0AAI9YHQ8_9PEZI|nr:uncharacterized protein CCOS01_15204 [Colletotrichum costaricense]KAK1510373.1 hypothetical protein CCOS01_15204 [Colletotrichum costaricense]